MEADYVIAGAGPAAVSAVQTIAKNDPDGSIIMLSAEQHPPYSRMAIPYVLTGLIDEEGTHLRHEADAWDKLGVKIQHAAVSSIDPAAKSLMLGDGSSCKYGKLLIATGASPVKPPVDGLDLPNVHHCWTLDDAKAIAERATEGSKVVLMGAGFIGCIILEALASQGAELTVVEAEDRMVPRMMDETAGNMLKSWCQEKGINVLTSTRVTAVSQGSEQLDVALDNGDALDADLVVVATGVKSNIGFLEGSGIATGAGIKVNEYLCTTDSNIFAAGDCAEARDFSGGWSVQAIQPTATDHGHIAALNMTGSKAAFRGSLNMNVLDTAGLVSASFGIWQGVEGGDNVQVVDSEHYRYTRLAFDGDVLVGAVLLGRTSNIGVLRGLIQSKTRLGIWKDRLMKDPNQLMEAYLASTF